MTQLPLPSGVTYSFEWQGHIVKWHLGPELRADVSCDDVGIPYSIDQLVRFMVAFNVKNVVVDGQELKRIH